MLDVCCENVSRKLGAVLRPNTCSNHVKILQLMWLTLSASHIPYMRSLVSTYSYICLLGLPLGVTVVCLIIWSFSLLHSEAMLKEWRWVKWSVQGYRYECTVRRMPLCPLHACYRPGRIYKKQTKCHCPKTDVHFSQMKWLGCDFSADFDSFNSLTV